MVLVENIYSGNQFDKNQRERSIIVKCNISILIKRFDAHSKSQSQLKTLMVLVSLIDLTYLT